MLFSDMGGIDIEEVAEEHPDHVGRGHFSNLLPLSDFQAKEVIASVGVTGSRAEHASSPILTRARAAVRRARHDAGRDQPARRARRTARSSRSTRTWTWRTRPGRARRRCCTSLGVGDEETRQAREATPFELAGEAVDAAGPPRRGRQRHRVRRQPRPRHRRRRRLADALRRGPRARRPAGQLLRDRRQPVGARRPAAWPSSCSQKPGVDKIAVMMSIVSNTRVDIVARGVIKACLELGYDPAEKIAIFRIPGAWEEEGFKILERYGVRTPTAPCRCTRPRGWPSRRGGRLVSILVDADTTFIVQGITGREAVNLTRECLDYGARRKVVGGVTPGRRGPRRPRRAGLRHRRPGGRAPRRADRRLRRHRPARLHARTPCSRRSRTASS